MRTRAAVCLCLASIVACAGRLDALSGARDAGEDVGTPLEDGALSAAVDAEDEQFVDAGELDAGDAWRGVDAGLDAEFDAPKDAPCCSCKGCCFMFPDGWTAPPCGG